MFMEQYSATYLWKVSVVVCATHLYKLLGCLSVSGWHLVHLLLSDACFSSCIKHPVKPPSVENACYSLKNVQHLSSVYVILACLMHVAECMKNRHQDFVIKLLHALLMHHVRFMISSSVLHHEKQTFLHVESHPHMIFMENHLPLVYNDLNNAKSYRGIFSFIAAICRDILWSNRQTAIKPTSLVMTTHLRLRCVV